MCYGNEQWSNPALKQAMDAPFYKTEAVQDLIRGNAPVAIIFLDNNFVLREFNRGYFEILDRYKQLLPECRRGMPYFDFLRESRSRLEPILKKDRDLCRPNALNNFELEVTLENETIKTYWDSYHAPVIDQSGKVRGLLAFIQDLTPRTRLEAKVRKLNRQVDELKTTLRTVMALRQEDRAELEKNMAANIRHLVLPLLSELTGVCTASGNQDLLGAVAAGLDGIASSFSQTLSSSGYNLTPREIQIAHLIKEGKSTKEIADLFHLSQGSINTHRNNIRKKLGLNRSRTGLKAFLMTLA